MTDEYPMPPGFYNMDCMDAMKRFPDSFFDLAVCDPPYGIGIGNIVVNSARPFGGGGHSFAKYNNNEKTIKERQNYVKFYHPFDDSSPPDETYFRELFRISKNQIIWGGNFLLDYLGKTSCMIIWDKKRRGMNQADCEIAWTSLKGQSRIFAFQWNGMLQEDMKEKEYRIHPTQKPVALYAWLLSKYAKPGDRILDTHVGSASSLIACHRAGLEYWGFEIDETYYKMANERLEREIAQVNMFDLMNDETQLEIG